MTVLVRVMSSMLMLQYCVCVYVTSQSDVHVVVLELSLGARDPCVYKCLHFCHVCSRSKIC